MQEIFLPWDRGNSIAGFIAAAGWPLQSREMLELASVIVIRATRLLFVDREEPALWTIVVDGHVVGTLLDEAGIRRLTWFKDADPRLVAHAGALDGDVEALATALGTRLGRPVCLELLPS